MAKTKEKTSAPTSEAAHSSLVGGSTAERRLQCPGSWQLEQKLPPEALNQTSSYANEGTALHAAMEHILDKDVKDLDEVLGMSFGEDPERDNPGYVIDDALLDEAIGPCVDFFDALVAESRSEGGLDFMLEARCQFPGIPDAFGTSDVIARTDKRSIIVDWKFGAGVPVKAEYPVTAYGERPDDGSMVKVEGVRPNAQLMFYARAAQHTFPEMFGEGDDWPVDLYIVQPRAYAAGELCFTKHETTAKKLETFRFELIKAIAEAKGDNPSTKRGAWCRFAACKVICPLHTGPAIDLGKLSNALERAKKNQLEVSWPDLYADLLSLADLAELFTGEVRTQAHAFIEAGHAIPGYKLVAKRATERYVDEAGAQRHAIGLGVDEADTVETKVKSPAQLAKVMEPLVDGKTKKDREATAREQLAQFTESKSSGTNLVHEDAKGEAVIPTAAALQRIAEKLALISGS